MARRTAFAEHDSTLHVKFQYSGIHQLIVLVDGLPLTFFGKGKTAYMKVADVIAWHERELAESNGHSGNRKVVDDLTSALDKFNAGAVDFS